jgi:hypothetical protein
MKNISGLKIQEKVDYTDQKFYYLTALYPSNRRSEHRAEVWVFRCDCGNEIERVPASVRLGHPKSCGCMTNYLAHKSIRLPKGEAAFRQLYRAYKQNSELRNYSFELSMSEFREITKQFCYYCGAPPSQVYNIKKNTAPYIYNGVDRLDNDFGYTLYNVVPCCGTCNTMKMDTPFISFAKKIREIYKNRFEHIEDID